MRERKHIRLKEYDYSRKGIYFITICTQNMESYFGKIVNEKMILSDIGSIANLYLQKIPEHFNHVKLHKYVIMPNHIHCIIEIVGSPHGVTDEFVHNNQFGPQTKGSLSVIINLFKSSVTRWANHNKHNYFAWQKRFYDRKIRNRRELEKTSEYICMNPLKWKDDKYFG